MGYVGPVLLQSPLDAQPFLAPNRRCVIQQQSMNNCVWDSLSVSKVVLTEWTKLEV